jgi:hypothetical protein
VAIFRGRWFWIVYVIVGLIVAWEKHYITLAVVKVAASAVLAVFLWWLALLGVDLHIH